MPAVGWRSGRVVRERPAEREPLEHPARIGARPLVASVPKAEAIEQNPDPLAPLGHAIEAPVEVEVLDRGQLPIDERLVGDVADLAPLRLHLELAGGGDQQAGAEAEERRLAGAVRAGD